MKRTIAFSLTLLMMLSLFTGCGAADSSATATDSSNGTESSTQEVFPENNLDSTAADDSGGMIQSNAASARIPAKRLSIRLTQRLKQPTLTRRFRRSTH